MTKTLATLNSCRRIFRKYRDRYPVSSRVEAAKAQAKAIAYRGVFALGLDRAVIARRSELPDDDDRGAFVAARTVVTRMLAERFHRAELAHAG